MLLEQITKSLADLDKEETISLTVKALLGGVSPQKIVLQGLFSGMEEVTKRYGQKEHLFPDMYKASIIYQETLAKVKQQIVSMETYKKVWGVIGLASCDMQDFGKNIVLMTLESNGFEVKDLGKSVPAVDFLQAAREGADFIAISIMTNEGVEEAKSVVEGLKDFGLRERVKVIVGGASVTAAKAASIIGADGYAEDAAEVVEFLKIFFQVKDEK